jgi:hypothetical protein
MTKQLTQLQVRELIDKRDPALLFQYGVPKDEYMGEAYLIVQFLNKTRNVNKQQLGDALKEIFASRFTRRTVEINPNAYDILTDDIISALNTNE